ncbi:hypothetical protein J3R83DRAFT_11944 [Lanmaoa asiatica]|nr:hypothetical protein J3R83DRAFT_11944 [Lanmaoa asiatica]
MLRVTLFGVFSLVATALVPTLAVQVPLASSRWRDEEWNLGRFPDPNATDHLVFETVYSLLQHWPNTRMRNGKGSTCLSGFPSNTYSPPGHNIVPGSISKGTLLYHGRSRKELPPGPDCVATDPEHSYHFCRDEYDEYPHYQQGCWHLTLMTTRALKVVYFDGNSAAKLPYGSMDTQDLIAWGRSGDGGMSDERQRMQDLCKWGKNFGVDGFVR